MYEAETCWYDLTRWPQWVDQLDRVVEVQGDWPRAGSVVVWESGPAGRGRVTERASEYEPRSGQTSEVQDDSLSGRQTVAFIPSADGVWVELSLDYKLKRRSPISGLANLFFIRRLMSASLARTLAEFGTVLKASRASGFK